MNICQDGLQVYFATETQQYYYVQIYGHYELQTYNVNSRPYFKKGKFGIWSAGTQWFIGLDFMKGQSGGYAFVQSDVFCPNLIPEWEWSVYDGTYTYQAMKDIGITCKCIFTKNTYIKFE